MIDLPDLPYAYDALTPVMSSDTLHFHHDKHHAKYVENTNDLAAKAGLDGRPLEEIIAHARNSGDHGLFNNAAQAWNHAFFWRAMAPEPGAPSDELEQAIAKGFGDRAALKAAFVKEGVGHFASGWAWLAARDGALVVTSTHDAETLATLESGVPLLVCDLWEHAYYLDKQNDRKAFLEDWFDRLANWSFASEQFQAAGRDEPGYRYAKEMADT